jgi:hypothetical protein
MDHLADLCVIVVRGDALRTEVRSMGVSDILFATPTWGEIRYHAYGLATFEFHNELYGWLQRRRGDDSPGKTEEFFLSQAIPRTKVWTEFRSGRKPNAKNVTIMTYIRNFTHHPENPYKHEPYSEQELRGAIETMVKLVQRSKERSEDTARCP